MKNILLFLVCVLLASSAVAQNATAIRNAEAQLKVQDYTVVNKQKCISGDRHNYESLAVYAWPDEKNPAGPYIIKDGQRSPEVDNYDGVKLRQMMSRVRQLAEGYEASHDERFARAAIGQLKCWFVDASTMMNPNLDYGQFIPGRYDNMGNVGGVSEAYDLVKVLNSIDFLKNEGALDKKTDKKLKKWFGQYAQWMQTSRVGVASRNVEDNIGIMYDILLYRICMYTGDKATRKQIIADFNALRLDRQVAEDGSQPRELKRTRAMSYSIYNIQHVLNFCELLKTDGVDYYALHGDKIDKAVQFIERYISNKQSFPYKEIGDWTTCQREFAELKKAYLNLRSAKNDENTAEPINPMALPSINVNQLK
ncbi:MAG: alginate lyase family protein [Prevotellaceae bacterium]|nr:alginate lyase family protein [Prevotellaceae bacterium]